MKEIEERLSQEDFKRFTEALEGAFIKESSRKEWIKSHCIALSTTPCCAIGYGQINKVIYVLQKIRLGYYS
tara:strand:+ start:671 stop:883 length:213 start_codon:yes stop_codon:yes gene_type:complete